MTAPRSPQDVWPDSADPVDEALAQLREPGHLLAEALILFRRAQDASGALDSLPEPVDPGELEDRHSRLIDESDQLVSIARAAAEIATAERNATMHAIDDGLDALDQADMETRATPPNDLTRTHLPRPVRGVTFTAVVDGMPLGNIGHTRWLWTETAGYVDIGAAETVDGLKDGLVRATFHGTLKTADAGMAVGVTHDGLGVLLPRVCIVEAPDE